MKDTLKFLEELLKHPEVLTKELEQSIDIIINDGARERANDIANYLHEKTDHTLLALMYIAAAPSSDQIISGLQEAYNEFSSFVEAAVGIKRGIQQDEDAPDDIDDIYLDAIGDLAFQYDTEGCGFRDVIIKDEQWLSADEIENTEEELKEIHKTIKWLATAIKTEDMFPAVDYIQPLVDNELDGFDINKNHKWELIKYLLQR